MVYAHQSWSTRQAQKEPCATRLVSPAGRKASHEGALRDLAIPTDREHVQWQRYLDIRVADNEVCH